MTELKPYDPKRFTRPVPITRQYEVLKHWTPHAKRWWCYLEGIFASSPTAISMWSWWDLDAAFEDMVPVFRDVGRLARRLGDNDARELLSTLADLGAHAGAGRLRSLISELQVEASRLKAEQAERTREAAE
ncbi:hypothetical protein [Salinarimonas soli]|uniref:Uncharacterized protein n=1 Tax=Salinarimonas soli TaxID=1638099 RepID=A0A5B2VH73_9HYPH|nr:hypothetical protein [Salinarimonas soli]KAA2237702.1 hypothetical protein F0L46_08465 [Salinarimonas soli]